MDPMDVDLDLAEALVAVDRASLEQSGLELQAQSGPSRMTSLHSGNDGRPFDGLWTAFLEDQVVGWATLELPWRDNLELARVRIMVHPDRRRQGLGTRLLELALAAARENGRTSIATLAWVSSDGVPFLAARGFSTSGQHPYDVRRLDLHDTPTARWQQLYDEAAPRAADYELSHLVGPTPDDLLDGLVALHEAINDAPSDEGMEPDVWDVDRVRAYDEGMARRRQTTSACSPDTGARASGRGCRCSASTSSHPRSPSRRTPTSSVPTAATGSGC